MHISLFTSWTLLGFLLIAPNYLLAQSESGTSAERPTYSIGDLNLTASRVYTHVFKKTSLGHEHAIEGVVRRGHIRLEAEKAAGQIVFDMRSFKAGTARARKYIGLHGATDASTQKQVNSNMLGPAVLDVARYPTATFDIVSSTPVSETRKRDRTQYQLVGNFTLHGKTRPLTVLAEVDEKNGWTHLHGGFKIKQSDFGIKPFTKAFGVIGVADQLTIYGDLWIAGTPHQLAQRQQLKR